jgi:hypothetical protein
MFHALVSFLTTFRFGARLKRIVESTIRKAIVVAVAAVVLLAAVGFGLALAYNALCSIYGFSEIAAAGIVAGVLVMIGLVALATLPLIGPKADRRPVLAVAKRESAAAVDSGLRNTMHQLGPMTVVVIAFAAGLLLGRR